MIPRTTTSWQQQLSEAFTRVEDLFAYLEIPGKLMPQAQRASRDFALRVPRSFASQMEKGNPEDPLLLQVLPRAEELVEHPGFITDPVGDRDHTEAPGVLHKYDGRILLIATGACGVHCRYCFRRHFPYGESNAGKDQWAESLELLSRSPDTREVILSGGDPLTLSDTRIASLVKALNEIPHLERLRIHSRLPVLVPERITGDMVDWLTLGRLQPILVFHVNHPREISERLTDALAPLRARGITLLNQAVLLRGVNDSPETLCDLSEVLFSSGILPYYLHMLDPVRGSGHFDLPEARAKHLLNMVRRRLPGYLVPRLVRETTGAPSKTPLL